MYLKTTEAKYEDKKSDDKHYSLEDVFCSRDAILEFKMKLQMISGWSTYLDAVDAYEKRVHFNHSSLDTVNPQDKMTYKGRIPKLIEKRIRTFCEIIWNYTSDPVKFEYSDYVVKPNNEINKENFTIVDQNLVKFFNNMSDKVNKYVKHRSYSFEDTLKNAVRSWLEFGYSCLTINKNHFCKDQSDIFIKCFDPKHVTQVFDRSLHIIEALTEEENVLHDGYVGSYYTYYRDDRKIEMSVCSGENESLYSMGASDYNMKFGDIDISPKWTIIEVFVPYIEVFAPDIKVLYSNLKKLHHNDKIQSFYKNKCNQKARYESKIVKQSTVDYVPIFVAYLTESASGYTPNGEVLSMLTSIDCLQSIFRAFVHAAKSDLVPKMLVDSAHEVNPIMDSDDSGNPKIIQDMMVTLEEKQPSLVGDQQPYSQVMINRNANPTIYIFDKLESIIYETLNPNFSLEEKGTARINKPETYARIASDSVELEQSTSKFIYQVLEPLLQSMFYCFYSSYKNSPEYKELSKDWKKLKLDPFNYKVIINNTKTMSELTEKTSLITQLINYFTNIVQSNRDTGQWANLEIIAMKMNDAAGIPIIDVNKFKTSVDQDSVYGQGQDQQSMYNQSDSSSGGLQYLNDVKSFMEKN